MNEIGKELVAKYYQALADQMLRRSYPFSKTTLFTM